MQLEDYFEFVSSDYIRIKGHRIAIEDVLNYYLEGYAPEQILTELPTLSLEQVHATITYYLHNRTSINAYLLRVEQEREQRYQEERDNPSPAMQRLRAIKAERDAARSNAS